MREAHAAWTAGELTIVDCREDDEHAAQQVPGTVLLPMSRFVSGLDDLPRDRPLAVLCRSGNRSGQVAGYLNETGGFGAVANIAGGIIAWAAEGLPYDGAVPR